MGKIKEKVYDWKNRLKDRHMLTLVVSLIAVIVIMGVFIYKKQTQYRQAMENQYNMAFFELVDYVQSVEKFLAKSLISSSPEHGAETLTNVWREANLASTYLSQLPISSNELANTAKFLNQVSDYSYSLSRKNIYNEALTGEELDNLKQLHDYSVELENTLNQLSSDMAEGRISWGELTKKGSVAFATQVDNVSQRRKLPRICRSNLRRSILRTHHNSRKSRAYRRRHIRRRSKEKSRRIHRQRQNRRNNIKWTNRKRQHTSIRLFCKTKRFR